MADEVRIRPARATDARRLVEIHFAAAHGVDRAIYTDTQIDAWSPPVTQAKVDKARRDLAERGDVCVIAEAEGQAAGFGSVFAERGFVQNVHVDPAFADRGIGSAILLHLEHLAREAGAAVMRLESSLNAEGFYRRHGWVADERIEKEHNGETMGCVLMSKRLA
ncbi:MAG: GNAT family N-acetyltransferase [Planctomycetota bacterium]